MNIKPKRYITGGLKTVIPEKGWVVLECEVISPKSSEGKTVYAYFDPQDVTDALLLLRDAAIRSRR
jgi:hypothetical protein